MVLKGVRVGGRASLLDKVCSTFLLAGLDPHHLIPCFLDYAYTSCSFTGTSSRGAANRFLAKNEEDLRPDPTGRPLCF